MDAEQLYESVLGVNSPWHVAEVRGTPSELRIGKCDEIVVIIAHEEHLTCTECGSVCSRHDSRVRRWRHLDTCEARTVIEAEVPRFRCTQHGVKQVAIPWAEGRVPYTKQFESYVIDLLLESTPAGVSRLSSIGWDSINNIKNERSHEGYLGVEPFGHGTLASMKPHRRNDMIISPWSATRRQDGSSASSPEKAPKAWLHSIIRCLLQH